MTSGRELASLSLDDVFRGLSASPDGLASEEAERRRARLGPNEIPEPPRTHLLARFAAQLTHPMALLLWAAGALAFTARTPQLAAAIWAVIWINAFFSFWQEYRAERALDELKKVLPQEARVMRDGSLCVVEARDLVVGDTILLEEGDRVSADTRLVWAERLTVDTSLLTGESLPTARHAEAAKREGGTTLDLPNLVFAGCTVVGGRGRGVVYATGTRTELGRVAHLVSTVTRERSNLERQVARVVRTITTLAVALGAVVFLLAASMVGMGGLESFVFAIGIVVALVPEGLLPMITLSLAVSVQRMARRNALVRRLSAVEALSAVTTICTDKTGTLTENEMTVRRLWIPCTDVDVSGAGFNPGGEVAAPSSASAQVHFLLAGAALCSNARLVRPAPTAHWHIVGDPTEGALLIAAVKARLQPDDLQHGAPRLREIAFDSWRKMMTVVVRWELPALWPFDAPYVALTKGASLEVLDRCTHVMRDGAVAPLTRGRRAEIEEANDRLAARGFRVLALAYRPGREELLDMKAEEVENGLIFVGLTAMLDPPRPEVPEAIQACRRAGIRVIMVTGDYGLTAEAIARHIGLADGPMRVVKGRDLETMDNAALQDLTESPVSIVFARVTPHQKLRIVEAYKRAGHVVAVTGDGVNDAPALRAAHVGIAMGRVGTDVAREAADIVLLDDNFATIVGAVEQGRAVYHNIRKFMTYVLASNVAELMPFLAMVCLKIPPALNVLQILSIDLGTDLAPALGLGTEPPEADVMSHSPISMQKPLMDRSLLLRAYGLYGLSIGAFSLIAFALVWFVHGYTLAALQAATPSLLSTAADPRLRVIYHQAMTACLTAIVFCQVGNVFACRSESASARTYGLGGNRMIWIGVCIELVMNAAMLYIPPLGYIYGTDPLPIYVWLGMLVLAPLFLALTEIYKWLSRKMAVTE